MRYVISDTHFGHGNIIDYCDRPFEDTAEMNRTLEDNWRDVVDDRDTVIHLGDVRHHPAELSAARWLNRLPGEVLLVRGNHDGGVGQNFPHHVVNICTIQHGRYEFYCEHEPVDEYPGWQLHGHVHNNHARRCPFIDPQKKRVNLSVELIDYTPLALDELVYYIDKERRYQTLSEARAANDYPLNNDSNLSQ